MNACITYKHAERLAKMYARANDQFFYYSVFEYAPVLLF